MAMVAIFYLDSLKFLALSQFGRVTFPPCQPIDVFGNDNIELVIVCVRQHPREFRSPVHGRSGGGKISVDHDYGPRVPIGQPLA